jgi:hypothetical protein
MSIHFDFARAGVISTLSIRQWSGRRGDRQAGVDTANRHSAQEGMIRVSKSLVPKEALEPIRKLATEARTYHYNNTIVWTDGSQFLPARLSMGYSQAMQNFRVRFDTLATNFCRSYPTYIENAPELLGRLFSSEDYPTPEEMRHRFSLEVSYEPVPSADHFFAELAEDSLAEFRRDLENKNAMREREMHRDLWERLRDPVVKMADALSKPDQIFRDSLVGNVVDIAERIDSLNIFDDPQMSGIAAHLRERFKNLDPDVLRVSEKERADAAETARGIANRIAASMCGFMDLSLAA